MKPNSSKLDYKLQEIWSNTPTVRRQEIQQYLDINRQTLWRWINDPACIRLSQAAKLCALLDIENPLEFITPV